MITAAVAVSAPTDWVHAIGLIASVLLGAVLCLAGAAKLVDLKRWRSESSNLGVPWIVAATVPVVELGVGALLIVGIGWPVVPVVAAVLLVGFSVVVIRELRGGRRPRCACFGAWSSAPLSGRTLLRNGLLIAAAAVSTLR